jgi:sugar lactone lactonase YvrE
VYLATALVLTAAMVSASLLPAIHAFSNGMSASAVLGQTDFTSAGAAANPMGLAHPSGVAFDSTGNLWVSDSFDNRVLEFEPPFHNGMNATLAIGQPSFTTVVSNVAQNTLKDPNGLAFDSLGNLWVADTGHSRVLEFQPPFQTGMNASVVIGQAEFNTISTALASTGLDAPMSVAFNPSNGGLWVADSGNDRILGYDSPFSNGMAASTVVGQPDFTTMLIQSSQNGMGQPTGLGFDASGSLWVADYVNNRVLEFQPPLTDGMSASLVLGQTDFVASGPALSQSGLSMPSGISFDSSGNVWVADSGNSRALEFQQPFSTGMGASFVVGQRNYTTSGYSVTPSSLSPWAIAFDKPGNLWATDTNNRILEFQPPFSGWATASLVMGQSDFTKHFLPTNPQGMSSPRTTVFDSAGNLWVADSGDSRVLRFGPPFANGMNASLALGTPNLWVALPTTSKVGLWSPEGLALDMSGNLWVADTLNNRLVEFKGPFHNGMDASIVIGQFGFGTAKPGTSQYGLTRPSAVKLDAYGDLWVADSGNNRVLEFVPPFSNGMAASLVLGQQDFSTVSPQSGQNGLNTPTDVALDSKGNLWVADSGNNRVLEFQSPFSNGMSASLVLGQQSMGTTGAGAGQAGLSSPSGITFDPNGNLWVADRGNSRVVEFSSPFSTGMGASLVLGQQGFGFSTAATSANGLRAPYSVTADSAGNVWVSDSGNNRLAMFSAPVTTTSSTTSSSTTSTGSTSTTSTSSSSSTTSSTSTTSSIFTTTSTTPSTTTTTSSSAETYCSFTVTQTVNSSTQTQVITLCHTSTFSTSPSSQSATTASNSQSSTSSTSAQTSGSSLTWLAVAALVVVVIIVVFLFLFLRRGRRP